MTARKRNMTRGAQHPTESLLKGLRVLLASLPSEEEKAEIIRTLRDARAFLEEIEALVEAFPTVESSADLSNSISRLDVLANRAAGDAPLRNLMGLRGARSDRAKTVNGAEDAKRRADDLARRLCDSDSADVPDVLERSGEPMAVLAELAAALGLRTRGRERKAELVRRISTHITNQRGYRLLRGCAPPSANGEGDDSARAEI